MSEVVYDCRDFVLYAKKFIPEDEAKHLYFTEIAAQYECNTSEYCLDDILEEQYYEPTNKIIKHMMEDLGVDEVIFGRD